MSATWQIQAILDDATDGLRLVMHATREVDGETQQTSDMMIVDHPAEARLECTRFAQLLGVEDYALVDRRDAA
jgi:hypothetical protein